MSKEISLSHYKTILREDDFPHHMSREALQDMLKPQDFSAEVMVNSDIDATLVLGSWGNRMTPTEHAQAVISHCETKHPLSPELIGLVHQTIESGGAEETRWTYPYKTRNEALRFQTAVGAEMAEKALQQINPDELDEIIVTSSSMLSPLLPDYIRKVLKLSPEVKTSISSLACASSMEAFQKMIDEPTNPLKPYKMIICVEPMTMLREKMDEQLTGTYDPIGLSLFGDGGFAFLMNPRVWEVVGTVEDEATDVKSALAAKLPSPYLRHQGEHIKEVTPWGMVGSIPEPDNGELLKMKLRQTAVFFRDFSNRLAAKLEQKVVELNKEGKLSSPDLSGITHAMAHRASHGVYEHVIKPALIDKLKLGTGKLQWLLENRKVPSNAPAATFGIELSRIFSKIKREDTILMFFFGAGAFGRSTIFRIRGRRQGAQ